MLALSFYSPSPNTDQLVGRMKALKENKMHRFTSLLRKSESHTLCTVNKHVIRQINKIICA